MTRVPQEIESRFRCMGRGPARARALLHGPSTTWSARALSPVPYSCGLHCVVHVFDLAAHALRNQVSLQLPVGCEHLILNRERLFAHTKSANLLVMGMLRIDSVKHGLHLLTAQIAGKDGGKISAAVSDDNHLMGRWQQTLDFILHGFRGKLVPRAQDDQILDAADD